MGYWIIYLLKNVCLECYKYIYGLYVFLRWYREGWMVWLIFIEGGMIIKMDLVMLILSFGLVGGVFFCCLFFINILFENMDFS